MTLDEVLKKVPALKDYLRHMPEEYKNRMTIKVHPPGYIIHQKDSPLDYFGIVASGEHRVINEFENGNIFMIEKNEPIDFIGEVTILAGMPKTSVTIETISESIILYISRADFEAWIAQDIHFLRLVSAKVALKLYRSSYNRGAKLFYPPQFLLLDYLISYVEPLISHTKEPFITIKKTRNDLYEEIGISVKTLNRTISKLKDEGLINIYKGKITMSQHQLDTAKHRIVYYRQMSVKSSE